MITSPFASGFDNGVHRTVRHTPTCFVVYTTARTAVRIRGVSTSRWQVTVTLFGNEWSDEAVQRADSTVITLDALADQAAAHAARDQLIASGVFQDPTVQPTLP